MGSEDAGHRSQWTQWLAAFAASSAMLNMNSIDIVWMTMRRLEEIPVMVMNTIAVIIGAILGAVFADKFGRKNTLLIMLIFVIPRAAYVFVDDIALSIYTLFVKVGSGLTCTLVPLYISEIAGPKNYGNLMVMQLTVVQSGILSLFSAIIFGASDYRADNNKNLSMVFLAVSISFHAIILGAYPETPQYLNWKRMYQEAGRSLSFFRGIKHVKVRKNATNLTAVHSWKGKISEIFSLENRRSLGIIFSLIIIKWASEMRKNDLILIDRVSRYGWSLSINYPLLAFLLSSLIISLCIMITIGVFERKLSLLFVIFVNLAASIIGMTPLIDDTLVLFGVSSVQYFGHLIFIGVTLAYVGKFFTVNVRAIAIALVVTFEILTRNIISGIGESLFEENQDIHFTYQQFALVSGIHIFAFFLILIFFPKINKVPNSEIEIETSNGIESL